MSALPLLGEPARGAPSETLAPILRKGFRPFFLAGAGFMALALPLWLLALTGVVTPDAYFGGLLWHAHEMVFGFSAAILAGFLLTAVGNWTGRETAVGRPLLALVALWLAGRVGVSFASLLPRGVPALLDLSFLPAVGLVLARPLVATQNRRNFVMLGVLGALTIANLVMHLDALGRLGAAPGVMGRHAALASVDVVVFLIAVMAGRIFPMFTRNATGVASIRSRPRLDAAALVSLAALTLTDVVLPEHAVGSVIAGFAAVLLVARAFDWGARHTLRIPLLWVLHAGYAFLPLGLALRAAALVSSSIPPSAATHALTAGGIGLVTLGMMARVPLGHTGRPLVAGRGATASFVLVLAAALVRVLAPIVTPAAYLRALEISGTLFGAGFAIYTASYARICAAARVDGKPG